MTKEQREWCDTTLWSFVHASALTLGLAEDNKSDDSALYREIRLCIENFNRVGGLVMVDSTKLKVQYFHPAVSDGKRLSTANIIWAERDRGSAYYRTSRFAMNGGKFPNNHPCAPFDKDASGNSQFGSSPALNAFRARGYWASCFPEGDGITFKWWGEPNTDGKDRTPEQVMQDIRECFGWDVEAVGDGR